MKSKFVLPLLLLVAAVTYIYMDMEPVGQPPAGIIEMSAMEAQQKLADNPDVQVIDFRTPQEFQGGHVKGAMNVDFYSADFVDQLKRLDKDKTYFVYCRSGNRSSQAVVKMSELGFTHVWHMHRGLIEWQGAGLPLVR